MGVDPIAKTPAVSGDGAIYTETDVLDLTLLQVVKSEQLVSKLEAFDRCLSTEAERLSDSQRWNVERTVQDWPDDDKELYLRAAAIVIETLKSLNPDLDFAALTPGREIVLPDPAVF